ncbi:hypothetical protein L198_01266 [Cryptococcus wingfieldii CBS 7118]|uniref:Uncharacterized protein n=1 Tax=Cryptococcus wingfieldii CBS 7118 TaxID=1295528 RepID=A0A1E3K0M2_9TREE|nr:hypothetical protein L198_01266 [Cryptococcus wingfieldii CBS 7118]ODO06037.1 hypothetical protein L198_01266 [Cryptococcus wingfieldii CBS 7118]
MSAQDHDAPSVKDPRIASSANSTIDEDDAALQKWGPHLPILLSPFYSPTSASIFNYSIVIWGAATIFGFISWLVTSPETWLHQERVERMKEVAGGEEKGSRFGVEGEKKEVVGENVGISGA